MKKIISISLTLIMMATVLHFSVATHYCCGTVEATKISLSGKLATCGMEYNEKDIPQTGSHFASHCCDNAILFYGINSNYFPSFSYVSESYQHHFQVFNLPAGVTHCSSVSYRSINTSVSPPDVSVYNSVDLSDICILRI